MAVFYMPIPGMYFLSSISHIRPEPGKTKAEQAGGLFVPLSIHLPIYYYISYLIYICMHACRVLYIYF